MHNTLIIIEKYLKTLDTDLRQLLSKTDDQENTKKILFFMEEAKKNLLSILNSLDHSILFIEKNKDKN